MSGRSTRRLCANADCGYRITRSQSEISPCACCLKKVNLRLAFSTGVPPNIRVAANIPDAFGATWPSQGARMAECSVSTITELDISPQLCRRAKCCEIQLNLPKTDSRYRKFLRALGFAMAPAPADGSADCCGNVHDVTLNLGPCRHLRKEQIDGEELFACKIYHESDSFPDLCRDFNCVSWAKCRNSYNLDNATLAAAQQAWATLKQPEASGG